MQNPFYLISAGLVLYGLLLSVNGRPARDEATLVMSVLGGYTVLLAASAWLIVRFGQVWDDARSILLIVALLFIALSVSFDRVVLDDPTIGAAFLAAGLTFSVAVTESVLAALGIRLAFRYRAPFYLQLAVLFAYPVLLAVLSITDREPLMSWCVLLFPVAAGLSLLALWPAARMGSKGEPASGTPWRWPLYPWSLFVLVFVGVMGRSYGLTMTFEIVSGSDSGFDGYFLVPLLMAGAVLLLELGKTAGSRVTQLVALIAPMAALGLAFPGPAMNVAQANFQVMLTGSFFGPAMAAIGFVAAFYVWAWLRGFRWAEFGVLACLLMSAVVGPDTVDLQALAQPSLPIVLCVAAWLAATSLWRRASIRAELAMLLAVALAAHDVPDAWLEVAGITLPIHVAVLLTLVNALCFRDAFARSIRFVAPAVLGIAAIAAVVDPMLVWVPVDLVLGYLAALVVLAIAYCVALRRRVDVVTSGVCAGCLTIAGGRELYEYVQRNTAIHGLAWLCWGIALLAAAIFISLIKGGLVGRLWRWLAPSPSSTSPAEVGGS